MRFKKRLIPLLNLKNLSVLLSCLLLLYFLQARQNLDVEYELPILSEGVKYHGKLEQLQTLGRFSECGPHDETLVFVHSAIRDNEIRDLIRNTWGNRRIFTKTRAKIFFVVGSPAADGDADDDEASEGKRRRLQQQLQWEQDIHLDLVQAGKS